VYQRNARIRFAYNGLTLKSYAELIAPNVEVDYRARDVKGLTIAFLRYKPLEGCAVSWEGSGPKIKDIDRMSERNTLENGHFEGRVKILNGK
jgi:hypothetical protein